MITFKRLVFVFSACTTTASCASLEPYRQDLLSDDVTKIDNACYVLGEAQDTAAVTFLLTKLLDPRMTTNLRFKGTTANYCRLGALQKIAGMGREESPISLKWTHQPLTFI